MSCKRHVDNFRVGTVTKKLKCSIEDDLICRITLDIPVDAVIAFDGFLYDRSAISEWFSKSAPGTLPCSPMTRRPMKPVLCALPWFDEFVESMVRRGLIDVSAVANWREAKEFRSLEAKAKAGDVDSMYLVGKTYWYGNENIRRNFWKAMDFFRDASLRGHLLSLYVNGLHHTAIYLLRANRLHGLLQISKSAWRGYSHGAFFLGRSYYFGNDGLPVDYQQATKYLSLALDRALIEPFASEALEMLDDINCSVLELLCEEDDEDSSGCMPMIRDRVFATKKDGIGNFPSFRLTSFDKAVSECPKAQLEVGLGLINRSEGYPEDNCQSLYWLQKSAENGNVRALSVVGKNYAIMSSDVHDRNHGMMLLSEAASKGCHGAACFLAECYAYGDCGVGVDYEESITYVDMCFDETNRDFSLCNRDAAISMYEEVYQLAATVSRR